MILILNDFNTFFKLEYDYNHFLGEQDGSYIYKMYCLMTKFGNLVTNMINSWLGT